MLKKNNTNFIFTFLLFLNPFITFFNSNVYEIIFYLNDFLFLFTLSLFVFLFNYLLINKKFFTTIVILYFLLFKYKFIYTILEKINLLNFIYPIILTFLLYFFLNISLKI